MYTGGIEESYKYLERYVEGLKSTNPGSRSVLEVDKVGNSTKQFKRVFFSFHGCIIGFENVFPMLFLDGTFLKGKYKGVLLSAVGKNGNQGLYLLAFAAVSGANINNWGCDPKKWAEAYCVKSRYGETTSNAVKLFNNWVNDVRELPITEFIDKLRLKLMKWFDDRPTKLAKWKGVLCHFTEISGMHLSIIVCQLWWQDQIL